MPYFRVQAKSPNTAKMEIQFIAKINHVSQKNNSFSKKGRDNSRPFCVIYWVVYNLPKVLPIVFDCAFATFGKRFNFVF